MKVKICITFFGEKLEDLFGFQEKLKNMNFEMIEIRIDYFREIFDEKKLKYFLRKIKENFNNKDIIFTLRTKADGGNIEISLKEYEIINSWVLETKYVDFIDFEILKDEEILKKLILKANERKIKTILSYHNFIETPCKVELFNYIKKMRTLNGDIKKIAVMPNSLNDVLELLKFSLEMKEKFEEKFIFISMGKLGMITRILGEIFGSYLSFATVEENSLIGQINVEDLGIFLDIIHKNY